MKSFLDLSSPRFVWHTGISFNQAFIVNIGKTRIQLWGTDLDMLEKESKKAKIRNQYNQAPHPTQDTTWESDKNTRKRQTQESQEASSYPAGDDKAAMNRQKKDDKHKT